jgi:hypothetical protein
VRLSSLRLIKLPTSMRSTAMPVAQSVITGSVVRSSRDSVALQWMRRTEAKRSSSACAGAIAHISSNANIHLVTDCFLVESGRGQCTDSRARFSR